MEKTDELNDRLDEGEKDNCREPKGVGFIEGEEEGEKGQEKGEKKPDKINF